MCGSRITLLMVVLALTSAFTAAAPASMIIKYPVNVNGSKTPEIYKLALVKLVLEHTSAEYGDYRLELPEINAIGAKRLSLLLSEGAQVNLIWSSPNPPFSTSDAFPIAVDIDRGLKGDRLCLINRNINVDFNRVTDLASFRQISLGQGLGWQDIDIYHFNQIYPITGTTFDGLLAMLAANRFSCLPLGADEINGVLEDYRERMPMLGIESNLLVHYDFPIYFYVSAKEPLIAERFRLGMKKIQANGEFDRLFARFYQGKLDNLKLGARRVICLKAPSLPLDQQCVGKKIAGAKARS